MSSKLKEVVGGLCTSLLGFDVLAGRSERTAGGHGDVRVSVLSLRAAGLVEAVARHMLIVLGVHIPAELLRSRLRIVKLLLRHALHRFKLVLENFELCLGLGGRLRLRS